MQKAQGDELWTTKVHDNNVQSLIFQTKSSSTFVGDENKVVYLACNVLGLLQPVMSNDRAERRSQSWKSQVS